MTLWMSAYSQKRTFTVRGETERCRTAQATAPLLDSTDTPHPNPLLYSQKPVSTFPEPLPSAILGRSLRGQLGNLGLRRSPLGVVLRCPFNRLVPYEQNRVCPEPVCVFLEPIRLSTIF